MPGDTGRHLRADPEGFRDTVHFFCLNTTGDQVLCDQSQRPVVIQVRTGTDVGVDAIFRVVVAVAFEGAAVIISDQHVVVEQVDALEFGGEAQRPFLPGRFQFRSQSNTHISDQCRAGKGL
ncbi:hypothetical protein ESCOCK430B_26745 [Escherichia coli]